jgi:hypothetical protein
MATPVNEGEGASSIDETLVVGCLLLSKAPEAIADAAALNM